MTPKNIKAKSGGVIARLLTLCLVAFAAIGASGEQHNGATTGGGFADFRKQQQARLFSAIDDTLSQKAEDTLLGFAAMRKAEVNLQTELGGRKGQLGVNLIGAFADAGHYATGWQLRAYGGGEDSKGVNAGVFYRQINNGNILYGVNAFADYEDGNYGNFLRYSFGGEIQNTLFAINANYYLPETESRPVSNGARAYSRRGFDLNFRLNVPKWHFMKVRADYYKFDGKDGTKADVGFRYGVELALPPFDGLQVGVLYDGGSDKFGGDLTYTHTIGEPPVRHNDDISRHSRESGNPDLFAAASREYSQRIATTNPTVAIPVGGFDYHSRVFVTGFYGTVGTIAASGGSGNLSYAASGAGFVLESGGVVRFSVDAAQTRTATITIDDANAQSPPVSIMLTISAVALCSFIRGCGALGHPTGANPPPALPLATMLANAGANVNDGTDSNGDRVGIIAEYVLGSRLTGTNQPIVDIIPFLVGRGADINYQEVGVGVHNGRTALDVFNGSSIAPAATAPIKPPLVAHGARCNNICEPNDTNLAGQVCTIRTNSASEDCAPSP